MISINYVIIFQDNNKSTLWINKENAGLQGVGNQLKCNVLSVNKWNYSHLSFVLKIALRRHGQFINCVMYRDNNNNKKKIKGLNSQVLYDLE